jgi:hypothetical protein
MKIIILVLFLISTSSSALAEVPEWVEFGRNEKATFYANTSQRIKEGDIVKMWIWVDWSKPTGPKKALSSISQNEYDCKRFMYRNIAGITYSGKRGTGTVLENGDDVLHGWQSLPRGGMWQLTCGE